MGDDLKHVAQVFHVLNRPIDFAFGLPDGLDLLVKLLALLPKKQAARRLATPDQVGHLQQRSSYRRINLTSYLQRIPFGRGFDNEFTDVVDRLVELVAHGIRRVFWGIERHDTVAQRLEGYFYFGSFCGSGERFKGRRVRGQGLNRRVPSTE